MGATLELVGALLDGLDIAPKIARFYRNLFSGRLSLQDMAESERRRDSDTSGGEKRKLRGDQSRPTSTEFHP